MHRTQLALLVMVLGVLIFVGHAVNNVRKGIVALVPEPAEVSLQGDVKMGPDYVDCWMYESPPGSGNKVSTCVYTYCQPRETEEDCEARHDAKVARRQQAKPPCGTPGGGQ